MWRGDGCGSAYPPPRDDPNACGDDVEYHEGCGCCTIVLVPSAQAAEARVRTVELYVWATGDALGLAVTPKEPSLAFEDALCVAGNGSGVNATEGDSAVIRKCLQGADTSAPTASPSEYADESASPTSKRRHLLSTAPTLVPAAPRFAKTKVAPVNLQDVQSVDVDPFFEQASHRETAWWMNPDLPIPGEFLHTVQPSLPQVQVIVRKDNDTVLAICNVSTSNVSASGSGCGFNFTEPLADVSSILPTSGKVGDTVTVTGSGFSRADEDRLVAEIGGEECAVVGAVTDTRFTCVVGACPAGLQALRVRFLGHGYASSPVATQFTCSLAVESVEPRFGSLYGGVTLTLRGHGFAPSFLGSASANRIPVTAHATNTTLACVPRKYQNVFCGDSPDDSWNCPYQVVHGYEPVSITDKAYWLDFSNNTYIECELQATSELISGAPMHQLPTNRSGYPIEDPADTAGTGEGFGCSSLGRACGEVLPDRSAALAEADAALQAHPLLGSLADIRVEVYPPPDESDPLTFDQRAIQLLGLLKGESPGDDVDAVHGASLLGEVHLDGHFTFAANATPVVTAVEPATGYYWHTPFGMYMQPENVTTVLGTFSFCDTNNVLEQPAGRDAGVAFACMLLGPEAGWQEYDLSAQVHGLGHAMSLASFRYAVVVTDVTPQQASFGGGSLITVSGAGFTTGYTYMGSTFSGPEENYVLGLQDVGSAPTWAPEIISVKPHQMIVRLPQMTSPSVTTWHLQVVSQWASNLRNYTAECEQAVCQVTYSAAVTPTLRRIFPPAGSEGDTIRIYGLNLLNTSTVQLARAVTAETQTQARRFWAGACVSCALDPVVNCSLSGSPVRLTTTELAGAPHSLPSDLLAEGALDVVTCVLGAHTSPETQLYVHLQAAFSISGYAKPVLGDAAPKLPAAFGVPVVHSVGPSTLSGAGGRITITGTGFGDLGNATSGGGSLPEVFLGGLRPAHRAVSPDPSHVPDPRPVGYTLHWQTGCRESSSGSEGNFTVAVTGTQGRSANFSVMGGGVADACSWGSRSVELPDELGVPMAATVSWGSSSAGDAWGVDWVRLYAEDFGCVASRGASAADARATPSGCPTEAPFDTWCETEFEPHPNRTTCHNRTQYRTAAGRCPEGFHERRGAPLGGTNGIYSATAGNPEECRKLCELKHEWTGSFEFTNSTSACACNRGTDLHPGAGENHEGVLFCSAHRLYLFRGASPVTGEQFWAVSETAPAAATAGLDDCTLPTEAHLLGLPHPATEYSADDEGSEGRAQIYPWSVPLWLVVRSGEMAPLEPADQFSLRRAAECSASTSAALWEMAADPEYELRELPWRRTRAMCSFTGPSAAGAPLELGVPDLFGKQGYGGTEARLPRGSCSGGCLVRAHNATHIECELAPPSEPLIGHQALTVVAPGGAAVSVCGSSGGCAVQLLAPAAAPWTPALNLHDADELATGAALADVEIWAKEAATANRTVADVCGSHWPPLEVECIVSSSGALHSNIDGLESLWCGANGSVAAGTATAGIACNASELASGTDCVDLSTRYLCPVNATLELEWGAAAEARHLLDASVAGPAWPPTIHDVQPTTGHAGTQLTITGANFSDAGNFVALGGAKCELVSESRSQIVCQVTAHPAQAVPVMVSVPGFGHALSGRRSAPPLFTYAAVVESVEPAEGSWGGGITITIRGHGLGGATGYMAQVLQPPCVVESANGTHLLCIASPSPCELPGGRGSPHLGHAKASCGRRTGPRLVQVAVRAPDGAWSPASVPSNLTAFAFTDTLTPVLQNVTATPDLAGGHLLTLWMWNLGAKAAVVHSELTVLVGDAPCAVTAVDMLASAGHAAVNCTLGAAAIVAGAHEIAVAVNGRGRAVRDWPDEAQASWTVFEWPGRDLEGWERVSAPCAGQGSAAYPGTPNMLNGATDARLAAGAGYCAVTGRSEAACGGPVSPCCVNTFGAHAHCPEVLRSPSLVLDSSQPISWGGDITLAAEGAPVGDAGVWMSLRRAEAAEGEYLLSVTIEALTMSASVLADAVAGDSESQEYTLDFRHLGGGGYSTLLLDHLAVYTRPTPSTFCQSVSCPLEAPQLDVPLVVTAVSPAAGSYLGGQLVTLTGAGFSAAANGTRVLFRQERSEPWSVISDALACQDNAEAIRMFTHSNGMTLETCQVMCEEAADGCTAVDFYTESGFCGLYHEPCTAPAASHHGASSYRFDKFAAASAEVVRVNLTMAVVRTPQLLPFNVSNPATSSSVEVEVSVRRRSDEVLVEVSSGTCAGPEAAVRLTAPDGSPLPGSVDFAGVGSDGLLLVALHARTLRPHAFTPGGAHHQLFDTWDSDPSGPSDLTSALNQLTGDHLALVVSNRRYSRNVPSSLAQALRRCGVSGGTAALLDDGSATSAPGRPYDQLAVAGLCGAAEYDALAAGHEVLHAAPGGCWDAEAAVTVSVLGNALWAASVEVPAAYQYNGTLTPVVETLTPRMGSTAGGTQVEIKGHSFGATPVVTLDGAACASHVNDVGNTSDGGSLCDLDLVNCTGLQAGPTLVRCITGVPASSSAADQVQCTWLGCTYVEGADYSNSYGADSVPVATSALRVETPTGYAAVVESTANYTYIDRWSSRTTWGGGAPPGPGDSAMIPAGTTVLFDVEYAELQLLLVAGTLIFDDSADRNLTCGYIWLNQDTAAKGSAARLQVGTEEEPFQHKATITLTGNRYSDELPLIGAKVIGGYSYEQHGVIVDMHGAPRPPAFTFLNHTALPGADWLELQTAVEWEVGDLLALGPTDYELEEREELRILEVSPDKLSIRVEVCALRLTGGCGHWWSGGLLYKHFAESFEADGRGVDWYRAPIARLTRNVLVVGDNQTVGQQFGAQIQFTATDACNNFEVSDCVVMRLSNVEVALAGQGFFIGRYPIHFHRVGDVPASFVRNVSVHDTFNRAITIHGLRNYRIEHNVMFESRGHALFIEDGYEVNNTVRGNLGIVVRAVWSQLKVDETPAMFWTTNPDNKFQDNIACGSTHYGFWLRFLHKPDGLSESVGKSTCPIHTPMPYGHFNNNMAMTTGKYGMRMDPYYPTKGGATCDISENAVTHILNFKAAKTNLHGIYVMDLFVAEFANLQVVDPRGAGIEFDRVNGDLGGVTVHNSLFVDKSPNRHMFEESKGAVVVSGQDTGLSIINTSIVNHTFGLYGQSWPAVSRGGFQTYTEGLRMVNTKHHTGFGFTQFESPLAPGSNRVTVGTHEASITGYMEHVVWDMDGTLTGWQNMGYCSRERPCYALPYDPMHVADPSGRCDVLRVHNWSDPGSLDHPNGSIVEARVHEAARNGMRPGGLRCRGLVLRQVFVGPISFENGYNMRATMLYPDGSENAGLSGVSALTYDPWKMCGRAICSWDDGTVRDGHRQTTGGFNICINLIKAFNMLLEVGESYDIAEESPHGLWTDIYEKGIIALNMRKGDAIVLRFRLRTDYGPSAVARVNIGKAEFGKGFGMSRKGEWAGGVTGVGTPHGFTAPMDPDYRVATGRQLWGIPDMRWRLNTTQAGTLLEGRGVAHNPYIQVGSTWDASKQLVFGGSGGFTIEMWLLVHTDNSNAIIFQAGTYRTPSWFRLRLAGGLLRVHSGNGTASWCKSEQESGNFAQFCYVQVPSFKVNTMRWTHIAVTHDGGEPPSSGDLRMYIDGRVEMIGILDRQPRVPRSAIFGHSTGWVREISLDNVRIWDDKLDASTSELFNLKPKGVVMQRLAQGWHPASDSPGLILDYSFEDDFDVSHCRGPQAPMNPPAPATKVDLSGLSSANMSDCISTSSTNRIYARDASLNGLDGWMRAAGTEGYYGVRDELLLNSTSGNFSHGDFFFSKEENAIYVVLGLNTTMSYTMATCPDYGCPPPETEESFGVGARSFAWSVASGWSQPVENTDTGELMQGYTVWRKDDTDEPLPRDDAQLSAADIPPPVQGMGLGSQREIQSVNPVSPTPVAQDSIVIPEGWEVVLDVETPVLNRVDVYGTLRCPNSTEGSASAVLALSAHQLVIWGSGRFLCGTPEDPFEGLFTLTMHGNPNLLGEESFESNGNVKLHSKWIMAWGEFTLVGLRPQVTWTRLARSAFPGNTSVTVANPLVASAWLGNQGWEVVLTSSSFDGVTQSEVRTLQRVSGTELTLAEPLGYYHHGEVYAPGVNDTTWPAGVPTSVDMRAAVGLLTRNIIVRGGDLAAYDHDNNRTQDDLKTGAQLVCGSLLEEKVGWVMSMRGYLHRGLQSHLGRCHLEGVELKYTGADSLDCALPSVFTNGNDAPAPYPKGQTLEKCKPSVWSMWHVRGVTEQTVQRFPKLRNYRGRGSPLNILGCAFRHTFNAALYHFHIAHDAAHSDNWLTAVDNVMYDIPGRGIWDAGDSGVFITRTRPPAGVELHGEVTHNLIIGSHVLPLAHDPVDKQLKANKKLNGIPLFHVTFAKYSRHNYAVGQEHGPGHHMAPRVQQYGNLASGCLLGFHWDSKLHPGNGSRVGNVTAWKCQNYALLAEQNQGDLHVTGVMAADIAQAAVYTHTTAPQYSHLVSSSLLAGQVMPGPVGCEGRPTGGLMTGDVSGLKKDKPLGTGKPNHIVWMPENNGRTFYRDLVFAAFEGENACGMRSRAVVSNDWSEEHSPPANFASVTWRNTTTAGRMDFRRSQNGGSWNIRGPQSTKWWPGSMNGYCNRVPCIHKCQTYPCDAFQHNKLLDMDGTFTADAWADGGGGRDASSHVSLLAMQPIYERSGAKYFWPYYIVDACQAALGSEAVLACPWFVRDRADLKAVADDPTKMGVVRADRHRGGRCEEVESWNAYLCENMKHVTLHVRSTDARDLESDNTERTAAPFGVYDVEEGYLDLLSGMNSFKPRSFSNPLFRNRNRFWPILAANHTFQFHFTGKTPRSMDFFPVDFDNATSVRIQMFFTDDNRKEFWVEGQHVEPVLDQSLATLDSSTGTNYWYEPLGSLTFIITGGQRVSLKITKVTLLPATAFFGHATLRQP
ncbi:hypothetical protein CYMTET_25659 [Cymbomonas tetramitiformis]|uniref:G8 domain-containing protein n=1 Tax=Cymbomonas tetramitiformis TaxID=36881 RepID=A0AAE0FTM8_9CHLO|nr:hypothetical protein CYMTET_25659 [Cymbomonas tetramitiformis]